MSGKNTEHEFGSMNDIMDKTKMTAEGWAGVRKEYIDSQKRVNTFSLPVLLVISVALVGLSFLFDGFIQSIFIGVAIWGFYRLIYRSGHAEGYIEGYDIGQEAGVHKAHGMSDEDVKMMLEIHDNSKSLL